MANIYEGPSVRLRAVEPEDWEYFYEWDHDTENGRLNDEIWPPTSREMARAMALDSARRPELDSLRLIIETHAGEFIGSISTHNTNRRCGTFMYGVSVLPQHRRQGYASEAIRLVLRYFFQERRYQKVNAEVYSFNEPSQRLHEHLGFALEGRLRRMVYSGGTFHDTLVYGLTREEFEANGLDKL